MLINLRNALMGGKRLPYDAEVEYLESTGTQYINTGVYGDSDTVAEFSFAMTDSARSDAGVFGSRKRYMDDCFCTLRVGASSGAFWMAYGDEGTSANYISTVIGNTTAWHTARLARSWSIDTSTGTAGQYTFTTPTTLKVFAADMSASGRWYAKMRLASLKIYSNGILVRDYIPVRKGTTGYLYDRVSGKLFGNAGTGDFALGQDVVPVEWLQTDGAAYIDTGLEMADGHEVRAEHYFKRSTTRQLMGSNGSRQYYGITADGYVEFGLLGTYKSTVSVDEAKKYLVSYAAFGGNNTGSIYEGDTLLWSSSGAYYGFSNSFKIFLVSGYPGYRFVAGNKIASFKHIANSKTIQSLLSVRVGSGSTWEGAMMDTLTRRIYRNAGTGAFTYGNDLKYPIPSE